MSKQRTDQKPRKVIREKLPVVLGIKPIFYLPVIYGIVILLILFHLFINPGIKQNGTWFHIESRPGTAEVFVDDVRSGTTPCTIFVEKGTRKIELRKPGFNTADRELIVKGRILFTRFFPLKGKMELNLTPADLDYLISERQKIQAGWGLSGIPEDNHYIEPVWSMTASDCYRWADLSQTGNLPANESFDRILEESLPFVDNSIMLSDSMRGYLVHAGKGSPLTAQSLLLLITKADQILSGSKSGGIVYWLNAVLSKSKKVYPSSAALNDYSKKSYSSLSVEKETDLSRRTPPSRIYGGLSFLDIPEGEIVIGDPLQSLPEVTPETDAYYHKTTVSHIYIMDKELSLSDFDRFLADNKDWDVSEKTTLINKDLVDDGYLSDILAVSEDEPVTGISWYAAKEYCRWFTDKYLKGTGLVADLPSETEWEHSSIFFKQKGRVWEWCSEGFAPYAYCFETVTYSYSPAASVRGGCRLNESGSIKPYTRGAQPKNSCSPLTGFRIVLRQRD